MSKCSGQQTFFGPSTVAVHDDANVLRKRCGSQSKSLVQKTSQFYNHRPNAKGRYQRPFYFE
jgi:hypothetical protein